jgi:tetratricopeptide (TPR) repeat protein
MVTGLRAFRRDTSAETMAAILHEEPPEPSVAGNRVPAELGRLIRQCLVKNPNQRPQSARDLALGLRATGSDHRIPSVPQQRSSWLTIAVPIALVVGGLIFTAVYLATRDNASPNSLGTTVAKSVDAIAVLPFVYTGADPTTLMLSETLAGHIIDSLGQVRRGDLKIRPLSSVSRYSRQRLDLDYPTIGRALNVPVIVTGTMEQSGMDLTIRVEVVEAREHDVRWSQLYHGRVGERLNLDVQDQIAQDVAAHLGLRLSEEERRRLTLRGTADAEAYDLYRQALLHFNRFTRQGLADAIDLCNRAIARDQKFALAHATLARCHILRGTLYEGVNNTFTDAQAAVDRAVSLDENLALAHGAQGAIHLFDTWNWPAAQREFKLAIELDPDVPITHNLYGFYLIAHGELDKALDSIKKGQELDPQSAARRNELAICYNAMGRYREAIAEAREALKIDENFPLAYVQLGHAYIGDGMPEKAIEELTAAIVRGHQYPHVKGMLGCAYAAAGHPM